MLKYLFSNLFSSMPRNYKPVKPKKKIDPEAIKKAVADVTHGLSLRVAAGKYDIHYSVLYRHFKKGNTIKKRGGQTALSEKEENTLVSRLIMCSDWGYPIDSWTLRILIKESLDREGRTVKKFKDNLPGRDFVYSFLSRHKADLSLRLCQNIKRARASITPETINDYFDRLERELVDIPSSHIINYDETNLSDDPGRSKIITRRGCKYPERIMNSSKSSVSVMFSATGCGQMLPPYVVYKATNMYDSWREGGPDGCRFNRTKSGWFDNYCFSDYIETIVLPFLRRLDGKKYMIGDNLASHLSLDIIKKCEENNIHFIFLPGNSTHLTQPLDVAFFRPMKIAWRKILHDWKQGPGRNEATIPKSKFPNLLKKLCEACKSENIVSGFRKCGIVPLDRSKVLSMLPSTDISLQSSGSLTPMQSPVASTTSIAIDNSFRELLNNLRRQETTGLRKKRVKVSVEPGKSVSVSNFAIPADQNVPGVSGTVTHADTTKKQKLTASRKKNNYKPLHQSSSEDSDYSVHDSDPDIILSDSSANHEFISFHPDKELDTNCLQPDDFAIMKVYGKSKHVCRMYICKVTQVQDDGYIGLFYKKSLENNTFIATEEESFFSKDDFVKKLMPPVDASKSSSRLKNTKRFLDDISDFTIY